MPDIQQYLNETGIYHLTWGNLLLAAVGLAFVYFAISKRTEPYVLLPIGLGIILGNLPDNALTQLASGDPLKAGAFQESGILGLTFHFALSFWNILPPLIFLGLGAMTDFGPILANPKVLLLGAAAQVGIFVAFWGALGLALIPGLGLDFTNSEAAAIGIVGGADGPTTIFASAVLAPDLLGRTAVVAYSYMAGVVFIQPPLMRLLTTRREREIVMKPPREVARMEKLAFPVVVNDRYNPGRARGCAPHRDVLHRQPVRGEWRGSPVEPGVLQRSVERGHHFPNDRRGGPALRR